MTGIVWFFGWFFGLYLSPALVIVVPLALLISVALIAVAVWDRWFRRD